MLGEVPRMVEELGEHRLPYAARAMMTTDTRPKMAFAQQGGAIFAGVAKGASMMRPNMATMLAFVFCDARVGKEALDDALRYAGGAKFSPHYHRRRYFHQRHSAGVCFGCQ